MRYLNKITFINSAQIKYAEVNLDGNVHFIGTQGVGKSTLLRSVLFFYNADSLGLGIPKQKASYVDYYFKHSNSYIIYEVVREDGKFCVVSYKSQHKVCFRFFNGEYKQHYFVNANGNVPESWDEIAAKLDAHKVFYSKRKIDEYKEYRDIIYGNNADKKHEYRKYCILESKDYQQVPKTIQNVFLNSKMEAEFIKQTIILSLDNDMQIDLNQYAHHLNDFETQLTDIRKFKMPSTTSQAENIAKLYIAICHLEREKIQIAKELAWAVNKNEQDEPVVSERLKTQKEKADIFIKKQKRIKELFDEKATKINGDIRVQQENLKKARELNDEYTQKNITQILDTVEQKPDFDREQGNLIDEKNLLTAQFQDLEVKFQALLNILENQFNDFLNGKNAEKNNVNADFLTFKDKMAKEFSKKIADFREEHKAEIEHLRADWEDKKGYANSLKIKKETIKHTRFFEKEIGSLEQELQAIENKIKQLPIDKNNADRQIENIQKQWELDEQNLQKNFERDKEKIDAQLIDLSGKVTNIESYINNSKDSFYGWLTENYPDWAKTIGKVIDEKDVLFNTSLNPRLTEKSDNLYGIEIDLGEVYKTVKTVADYESDKKSLNSQIQELKQSISDLSQQLEVDSEKLKKKYQPKIREQKDIIREIDYNLEQSKNKQSETSIKLNELKAKAHAERKSQLEMVEANIAEATENAKVAEKKVSTAEEESTKAIKAREKERDKIIEAEKDSKDKVLIEIEAAIKSKRTEIDTQKAAIQDSKNKELSDKGADTKRLNEIDSRLKDIETKLNFIENNRALVERYRYDKEQYLDKVNDFKQLKQHLDKQFELENSKYEKQHNEIANELSAIQSIVQELDNKLKYIQEDISLFVEFQNSECFKSITEYFGTLNLNLATEKRVKILIDEVKSIHYEKLNNRKDELRNTATDFLGKFSESNIFKFKKVIPNESALLAFAEMLSDFVEERKIERIEKEVNERFAFIVSTIGTETGNLLAQSGEIQKIITKINNDFVERESIGAGVIKKIELRVEDSKNEIVQLLLMIKKFNDENSLEFGTPNLFSSGNQEKKNKDAVDLLKQFVKKINDVKRDIVSLSDSFELKFRIEENQNDTGWVEKLTNVGSEGTDTLVKAMLNIMLLNVFKESVSKRFKDFRLHCMMDEIGKLHPTNVRGILKFANDRNILLINGSPIENDALAFSRIYKLYKDTESMTKINLIITQHAEV
ncbi:MAG: ATP-binding protein [Lentimicrobium sp.]|nr:ATP-binding protein [Lentimicrobium sp.]